MRLVVLTLAILSATVAAEEPYPLRKAVEFHARDGLPNVLAKLRASKTVKIAYFGGSITEANGWRTKTLAWFRKQWPKADISEINAAIGGTGSNLGVYRLQQDALRFQPDLDVHRVRGQRRRRGTGRRTVPGGIDGADAVVVRGPGGQAGIAPGEGDGAGHHRSPAQHLSMSRRGCCYDNAVAESFWHTLKNELIHRCHFQTRDEAKRAIFEYIEVFYNRTRRHASIADARAS